MSRWIRGLLLGCALVAIAATAEAATRGGKLIYARYADSLLLDPVFNDANVDIWILTNLYDTLLQPTADGKGVAPGLATAWQVSDDGLTFTLTLRQGIKFADGTPHHGRGREMVARPGAQPEERHLELPPDRSIRSRSRARTRCLQSEAPRSRPGRGPRHLQHGDHAPEALRRRRRAPPTRRRPRPSPSILSAPAPSCSTAGSAAPRW